MLDAAGCKCTGKSCFLPAKDDRSLFVLVKARQASSDDLHKRAPSEYFSEDVLSRLDAPTWASMPVEHGFFDVIGTESQGKWLAQFVDADGAFLMLGRVDTSGPHGKYTANMVEKGLYKEVSMGMHVAMEGDSAENAEIDYKLSEVSFVFDGERGHEEGEAGRTPVLAWLRGSELRSMIMEHDPSFADGACVRARARVCV